MGAGRFPPAASPGILNMEGDAMGRYAVGIDLGTSSSSLAYARLTADGLPGEIHPLDILQATAPGEFRARPTLPSVISLPADDDPDADLPPWPQFRPAVIGERARRLAIERPGRTVVSPKSWLCHAGVDRLSPILPWGGRVADGISPFDCLRLLFEHLRHAFEQQLGVPLAEQELTIGVPASFDPVARQLSSRAAEAAGLTGHRLLEEPQAAFYCWLQQERRTSRRLLEDQRLLLVCDVGGGTTDFTLIRIHHRDGGELELERVAVGEHLIIGGDNMDLSLAHSLETEAGLRLDALRFQELVQRCREAKERLLSGGSPRVSVEVHGRGRRVVEQSFRWELEREGLRRRLDEGFFPPVEWETRLIQPQTGLRELGLPYAADARITAHLKEFLRRSLPVGEAPGLVLLHGGVFAARHLAERLLSCLETLYPGAEILPLHSPDLFRGVATGAAYASAIRLAGTGLRVVSGSPRAYFLGIERPDGEPAALCLVAQQTPGGSPIALEAPLLARANESVSFPLLAADLADALPGQTRPLGPGFRSLPPLTTLLRFGKRNHPRPIRVRLEGEYSEVGTLRLRLISQESDHVFDLDFNLRHRETPLATSHVTRLPIARREAMSALLEKTLSGRDERRIRTLGRELEEAAAMPRSTWPVADLRALGTLLCTWREPVCRQGRVHEEAWLQWCSFFFRPGTGCAGDEERVQRLLPLLREGPRHARAKPVRIQAAILLRRLAAGLTAAHQEELYRRLRPRIFGRPMRPGDQEDAELLRSAVSLEMLPREWKQELGETLLEQAERFLPGPLLPWLLSRLAARRPFRGTADRLIDGETVALWLRFLLGASVDPFTGQEFALARMIQRTGERTLDLPPDLYAEARLRLEATGDPLLLDLADGKRAGEAQWLDQMLGDALPPGLALAG